MNARKIELGTIVLEAGRKSITKWTDGSDTPKSPSKKEKGYAGVSSYVKVGYFTLGAAVAVSGAIFARPGDEGADGGSSQARSLGKDDDHETDDRA